MDSRQVRCRRCGGRVKQPERALGAPFVIVEAHRDCRSPKHGSPTVSISVSITRKNLKTLELMKTQWGLSRSGVMQGLLDGAAKRFK